MIDTGTIATGRKPRLALFAYGFRPFFLLAGVWAVLGMAIWLLTLLTGAWPSAGLEPVRWHMHEMLYGFVAAAVGGFLLTAVPNWTGQRGYAGRPLVALVAVWLFGRLVLLPGMPVSPVLAAYVDLAFFPALIGVVLPSLVRSGNKRNYPFLVLLGLLFTGNLLMHLEAIGITATTWDRGVLLGLDTVLLMVTLVGGRIVPSFTVNALKRRGLQPSIKPCPRLEPVALVGVVLILLVDLVLPGTAWAGWLALAIGAAHLVRLARWQGWRVADEPIVWVLHAAYLWLPLGLVLKGLWLGAGWEVGRYWLHALTIGAFAGMILAVTTRAALGHTGRDLVVAPSITGAYALLFAAALLRVLGPSLLPVSYTAIVTAAGLAWLAAFAIFVAVYAPILLLPRADGRPG